MTFSLIYHFYYYRLTVLFDGIFYWKKLKKYLTDMILHFDGLAISLHWCNIDDRLSSYDVCAYVFDLSFWMFLWSNTQKQTKINWK